MLGPRRKSSLYQNRQARRTDRGTERHRGTWLFHRPGGRGGCASRTPPSTEEIFGPVLAVMRANDCADALRIANHSSYALTGGIYSRSPKNIRLARTTFDVGNLYINRPITGALVNRQPFGGHRLSGVGAKAGGEDYLDQFMISRVVSENTLRRGFAPSEWE